MKKSPNEVLVHLLSLFAPALFLLLPAAAWAQAKPTVLPRSGWVATASSSNGGDVPASAIDGSTNTRFSTGSDQTNGQWFSLDMRKPQTFSQITIDPGPSSNDYTQAYQVFVSNDAVSWGVPVASGTGSPGVLTIVFPTQTARFVGVVQTGTGTFWWSISEINVYGPGAVPTVALSPVGWLATASSSGGADVPGNALDADLSTRWTTGVPQAGTGGQFFQIDMLQEQTLAKLAMNADGSSSDFPRGYQVFISDDPSNWGAPVASGAGTSAMINVTFAPKSGRFLKIAQTGSSSSWWSIAELTVFGVWSFPPVAMALPRTGWTATASPSCRTDVAANALDDDPSTRFSTCQNQTAGQSFQVDMLLPQVFTRISLDADSSDGDYPRQFLVYATNDLADWGTPIANADGTSQTVGVEFEQQTARYIKIVLTNSASSNWWSIHEFNVYGIPPYSLLRDGWIASASPNSGSARNGIDGELPTRWTTGAPQASRQWYQLDMLAPQVFNQVTLNADGNVGDYPRGYQIFVSNDPTNFENPVAAGVGSAAVVAIGFPVQNARYIRIVQTGATANWWSIAEVNVYSTYDAGCIGKEQGQSCDFGMSCSAGGFCVSSPALPFPTSGWIATASSSQGSDVPGRAIDGSTATRWSSGAPQSPTGWFQVDMIMSRQFSKVTLDARGSPNDYPRSYELSVSDDGVQWGSPVTRGIGTNSFLEILFPPLTARFFKITQNGTTPFWWSIHDLKVALVPTIVPSAAGIATIKGRQVAVFTYDNQTGQNQNIPVGPNNSLAATPATGSSDPISNTPPTWFLPGIHPGAFIAELTNGAATWNLAGLSATIDASANPKTLIASDGDDGVRVTIGDVSILVLSNDNAIASQGIVKPLSVNGLTPGSVAGHLDVSADGAATYHVPIWTPEAPVKPSIAIDYNSRNGVSYLGTGFTLDGMKSIRRCKTGFSQEHALERRSINLTTTDHLCLEGRLLIATKGEEWADVTEYRPESDPFTLVREHTGQLSDGTQYVDRFEVYRRDGIVETYGGAADAVLSGTGADPKAHRIEWAVKSAFDRSGNSVTYSYYSPSTAGGGFALIPQSITYGTAGPNPGQTSYSIGFVVQPMPKPETLYEAGFPFPLTHRLTDVTVNGPAPVALSTIKRYHIAYDDQRPVTNRFVVSSIQECDGLGGAQPGTVCMPATTFGWEPGLLEFDEGTDIVFDEIGKFIIHDNRRTPYYASAVADIDGDGRDDLIYRGIDPLCPGAHPGVAIDLSIPACTQLILYYRLGSEGYATPHQIDPDNTRIVPTDTLAYYNHPSVILRNFETSDIDGDGKAEIVQQHIFSPSKGTTTPLPFFTRGLADVNGDGLPDIVNPELLAFEMQLVAIGQGVIWPVSGYVNVHFNTLASGGTLADAFTAKPNYRTVQYAKDLLFLPGGNNVWGDGPFRTPGGSTPEFLDLNGDGAADILFQTAGGMAALNALTDMSIPLPQLDVPNIQAFGGPSGFMNLTGLVSPGLGVPGITPGLLALNQGDFLDCLKGTAVFEQDCWSAQYVSHVPLDINGDGLPDVIEFMGLGLDDSEIRKVSVYDYNVNFSTPSPVVKINKGGLMTTFMRTPSGITLPGGFMFERIDPSQSPSLSHLRRVSWAMHLFPNEASVWWSGQPVANFPFGLDVNGDPGLRTADFNGDGRDDLIAFCPLSSQNTQLNDPTPMFWLNSMMMLSTGSDFSAPQPIPTKSHPIPGAPQKDFRDRPSELSLSDVSVPPWGLTSPAWKPVRIWFNGQHGVGDPDGSLDRGAYGMTKILDSDGDGQPDFITPVRFDNFKPVFRVFRHEGKRPDLLTSVTNGHGAKDRVTYKPMIDPSVYTPASSADPTCHYPLRCVKNGLWLVSQIARDNGISSGSSTHFDYEYSDGRSDMRGNGWLGFSSVRVTDGATLAVTTTSYKGFDLVTYQNRDGSSRTTYPRAMVPDTTETIFGMGGGQYLSSKTISVYASETVSFSNGGQSSITVGGLRPTAHYREEWETDVAARPHLKARNTRKWLDYDAFANPQTIVDTTEEGLNNSNLGSTKTMDTITRTQTFDNDDQLWLLGKKRTEHIEATGPNQETVIQDLAYSYKDGTNLVETITRDINGGDATYLLTTFNRPSHGLITTITETDRQGRSRIKTIGYDQIIGSIPQVVTEGPLTYTQVHHPSLGVVLRAADPNGHGVSYTYDTFGRPSVVSPDGGGNTALTYAFNSSGTLVTTQTDGQPIVASIFDRVGHERNHRVQKLDGGMAATFVEYDEEGRVLKHSRPIESSADLAPTDMADYLFTHYVYDSASRLTETILPGTATSLGTTGPLPGGAITNTFSWLTKVAKQFDNANDVGNGLPPKLVGSVTTDGAGRPAITAVTKADGSSSATGFTYGPFGRMRTLKDAVGNITSMTYDAWGRRTQLVDRDIGTTTSVYDAFDQRIQDIFARGTQFHYFDDLGRPKGSTGPDGTTSLLWDVAANGLGKPAMALSEDDVTTTFSYDSVGRPTLRTTTVEGVGLSIGREYDAKGRLQAVIYPGLMGAPIRVKYDYSPLSGYMNHVSSDEVPSLSWTLLEQMPDGQLKRESFGNGVESTRAYLDNGFLSDLEVHNRQDVIQDSSYTFDGLGRLKQRGDDSFEYDDFSRLKTWIHASTGGPWIESYSYDDIDNLTTRTAQSPANVKYINETFRFGERGKGPHALTSGPTGSYDYDDLGNQKSAPGRTMAFNSFSLPRSLTRNSVTTSFKYDFFHSRVLKRNSSGSTTISISGLFELRLDGGIATAMLSVLGGKRTPIAQVLIDRVGNAKVEYIHDDSLGSARIVTGDAADVSATLNFDPWGNRISFDGVGKPTPTSAPLDDIRLGYAGMNHDDELGLIDMHGRLYDPLQRRFVSPDPFVQDPFDGQSLNRYSYVFNDPVNMVDPSGFDVANSGSDSAAAPPVSPDPRARDCNCTAGRHAPSPTGAGPYKGAGTGKSNVPGKGPGKGDRAVTVPGPDNPIASNGTSPEGAIGGPSGHGAGPGTGPGTDTTSGRGVNHGNPKTFAEVPGSPGGIMAPNAAPNGISNPHLNWAQRIFARQLPNTTMNPDTRDSLEGLSIVLGALASGLGAVREALQAAGAMEAAAEVAAEEAAVEAAQEAVATAAAVEEEAAVAVTTGRTGKQARLRELADDPNLGSPDRGWIRQEMNSIKRGTRDSIRNPPGKDLAHSRGREAAKGYDHLESPSNLQDRDLHRLQHKFDDFGRKNPERP